MVKLFHMQIVVIALFDNSLKHILGPVFKGLKSIIYETFYELNNILKMRVRTILCIGNYSERGTETDRQTDRDCIITVKCFNIPEVYNKPWTETLLPSLK